MPKNKSISSEPLNVTSKEKMAALAAINLALQKRVAKLEANEINLKNRIKALEEEMKTNARQVRLNLDFGNGNKITT